MAGKPAARLTDMTAHGGSVMGPGVPTVMIGKMPAATMGDQHVCPMVTPGTPPIPHVGGPILLGSTGVFIGKKPAARVGDMAMCVGPPSQVVLGCFTVMIGEAGSGSQAGSAGAAAAASTASPIGMKKVTAIKFEKQESTPTESYQILAQLKDKGGRPLSGVRYKIEDPDGKIIKGATSSEGMVVHSGYSKKGSFKITIVAIGEVKWSKEPIEIDKPVKIKASIDAEDGTEGNFFISLVSDKGHRTFIDQIPAKVSGKKLEGEWSLSADRWRALFDLDANACFHGVEAVVMVEDSVAITKTVPLDLSYDITVKDHQGNPMTNHEIEIAHPDGQMHKVKSDGSGKVKVKTGSAARSSFASHVAAESLK
ncbi:MAG: PAAR domain-containing protein [Fibrobacteria bacterium]|nr:PAAR domain-containing protein [Fibrobacteria bacterium]